MATTTGIRLQHRFADELPALAVDWAPGGAPSPALVVTNPGLAAELGIDPDWLHSEEGIATLSGNHVPAGARPVAMAYAGHQFGNPVPRLGDGRALLLGEVEAPDGRLHDLHLKGSGRTPFARGGDGRATLGSMLREHLISEAMAALGIPTTRSLAVLTTGEPVARARVEPGAVLTRVAASHLRVGTVEYARSLGDDATVTALVDHALGRHRPDAAGADRPALALLEHAVDVQARLVARWMLVGFIHGVMNTDNTSLSGEGIDYGPCAFMDRFDPKTVYSSIDHWGRYAYGNQPAVAQWNLARLAEALLAHIDPDPDTAVALATEALDGFAPRYQEEWAAGMAAKLGLAPDQPGSTDLFDGLLALMVRARSDHTSTFRSLAPALRGDEEPARDLFAEHGAELSEWLATWRSALGDADAGRTADAMDAVNPVYVPRNHLVEEALDAAVVDGDLGPFEQLLDLVTNPFRARPGQERATQPAPEGFDADYQTFCGT
jgi:serine/tyrosine/threonine adenylyltransferase